MNLLGGQANFAMDGVVSEQGLVRSLVFLHIAVCERDGGNHLKFLIIRIAPHSWYVVLRAYQLKVYKVLRTSTISCSIRRVVPVFVA